MSILRAEARDAILGRKKEGARFTGENQEPGRPPNYLQFRQQ
jgi:hypothetical protein